MSADDWVQVAGILGLAVYVFAIVAAGVLGGIA